MSVLTNITRGGEGEEEEEEEEMDGLCSSRMKRSIFM